MNHQRTVRSALKLGALVFVSFAVFAPREVYAYLDPGTGSMVIQILIGFLAGIGLIFKQFWHKIFRRK